MTTVSKLQRPRVSQLRETRDLVRDGIRHSRGERAQRKARPREQTPSLREKARSAHRYDPSIYGPLAAAGGTVGLVEYKTRGAHNQAAASALAPAAGAGGFLLYGYGLKARGNALERERPEGMKRSQYQKITQQHRRAHGVKSGEKPGPKVARDFYRTYPSELPAARYKHRLAELSGSPGRRKFAAAAAVPGALAVGLTRRGERDVRKASPGQLVRTGRRVRTEPPKSNAREGRLLSPDDPGYRGRFGDEPGIDATWNKANDTLRQNKATSQRNRNLGLAALGVGAVSGASTPLLMAYGSRRQAKDIRKKPVSKARLKLSPKDPLLPHAQADRKGAYNISLMGQQPYTRGERFGQRLGRMSDPMNAMAAVGAGAGLVAATPTYLRGEKDLKAARKERSASLRQARRQQQHQMAAVGKRDKRLYERQTRTSPIRATEFVGGVTLVGYGLSRNPMLTDALQRGASQAKSERTARALRYAERGRADTQRATQQIANKIRPTRAGQQLARVPRAWRPAAALLAGSAAINHARPIRRTDYKPVAMGW